jgi:hypothetical protein
MLNQEFMADCRRHGLTKHYAIAQCAECREIDNDQREYAHQFKELMSVMHGDGGHYLAIHGASKSCMDAMCKWYDMKAKIENMVAQK